MIWKTDSSSKKIKNWEDDGSLKKEKYIVERCRYGSKNMGRG